MFTLRRTLTTGLVTLAAAIPLFTAAAHAAAATQPPLNIVAIGDSYASGEGDMGSGWLDSTCQRSAGAAPQRAAGMLTANRPVSFDSAACFGSMINNPDHPAQSLLGTFGQLSGISMNYGPGKPIDALTISIGGNDLGFSNIVIQCMPVGNTCSTDPNVTGPLQTAVNQLGGYTSDPGELGALINAVNAMPYIDNVFLTEYPDPTTGADGNLCGSQSDPNLLLGGLEGVSQADAYWVSTTFLQELNTALQSAVVMANDQGGTHATWHYVTGISRAFYTHGYCNPNSRYVNTLGDSEAEQQDQNGTLHPNAAGQQAIANVLYNDYATEALMSASVSDSSPPVAGDPSSFTVQAMSFANTPVANATVLVDGHQVGTTDSSGALTVSNYVFPTAGIHTIVTEENGWSNGQAPLAVQARSVSVTANPSPITVGTIPALTVTATDSATGQLVPGTFYISAPGSSGVTVRSGVTADNVQVSLGSKTVTITGPTGKPTQIKVPVCPTLTFQPDNAAYAGGSFTQLISCKP